MEKPKCGSCQKPKATLVCGVCNDPICKYCALFLDENNFSFLPKLPPVLTHTTYCGPCFQQNVTSQLEAYEQNMERAKNINVFMKDQGKETRLMKRIEKPLRVFDCKDREETLLRLAFLAALAGFNAMIDVQLSSVKVKTGSRQTMKWSGVALPTNLDTSKVIKDRSIWQNPN